MWIPSTEPSKRKIRRPVCRYSGRYAVIRSGSWRKRAASVNLRTLQQYENRSKDIGKAAGSTLLALSRVLGCRMEDLLEYNERVEGTT